MMMYVVYLSLWHRVSTKKNEFLWRWRSPLISASPPISKNHILNEPATQRVCPISWVSAGWQKDQEPRNHISFVMANWYLIHRNTPQSHKTFYLLHLHRRDTVPSSYTHLPYGLPSREHREACNMTCRPNWFLLIRGALDDSCLFLHKAPLYI